MGVSAGGSEVLRGARRKNISTAQPSISQQKQATNSLVGKGFRPYFHPRRLAAAFERQHIPSTVHFCSGAGSGGDRGPHHLAPTWLAGSNGNEKARTAHVAPPPFPSRPKAR